MRRGVAQAFRAVVATRTDPHSRVPTPAEAQELRELFAAPSVRGGTARSCGTRDHSLGLREACGSRQNLKQGSIRS